MANVQWLKKNCFTIAKVCYPPLISLALIAAFRFILYLCAIINKNKDYAIFTRII